MNIRQKIETIIFTYDTKFYTDWEMMEKAKEYGFDSIIEPELIEAMEVIHMEPCQMVYDGEFVNGWLVFGI